VTSYLAIRNGEVERSASDLRRLTGRDDALSCSEFRAQLNAATRDSRQAFSSSATHSMCGVCGNRSTGRTC
jgi:hypothetical protein